MYLLRFRNIASPVGRSQPAHGHRSGELVAMSRILELLNAGAGNLAAYLAAHVLLCLLPAFFIAGAMAALIPKASITRWLGRSTPYHVSYPAAAAAGSLLAVCSCTIVPLFAGIYRKGAGIGPAITFLFFAPAGNILALSYTGSILGVEFAAARFILCLLFGIGIGLIMALMFARDDARHDAQTDTLFATQARIGNEATGVLLALVGLLIAGTLQVSPLGAKLVTMTLPLSWAEAWQAKLLAWVPFDAAKGEEGVSVQGSMLILLLALIAATAWKGLENIGEGANRWTWITLGLAGVDPARRSDADHRHLGRTADFHHRTRARSRNCTLGRRALRAPTASLRIGKRGCGRRGDL